MDNIDIEIDADEVLNLEQQQYQIGYQEGVEQSAKEQYLEGKQFGYQTGFQRFLIVGYIHGLIEEWESQSYMGRYSGDGGDGDGAEKKKLEVMQGHLQQLKSYVDISNDGLLLNNDEKSVARFEVQLKKARNKLRVICQLCKESWKINEVDKLIETVGGAMQVSENVDDMW